LSRRGKRKADCWDEKGVRGEGIGRRTTKPDVIGEGVAVEKVDIESVGTVTIGLRRGLGIGQEVGTLGIRLGADMRIGATPAGVEVEAQIGMLNGGDIERGEVPTEKDQEEMIAILEEIWIKDQEEEVALQMCETETRVVIMIEEKVAQKEDGRLELSAYLGLSDGVLQVFIQVPFNGKTRVSR